MQSRHYRVVLLIPMLGLCGIVFWAYVVLYSAGLIEWRLFSKVESFNLTDRATLLLHALFFVAGGFLLALRRVKADVTDDGIRYHGIMRSRYIRWRDVTKIAGGACANAVDLWSGDEHISLPEMFSRQAQLRDTVFERVRENSRQAEVDETYGPLRFRRRRKRKG